MLVGLSVGLSAVYCGKMAEWIRMPFEIVSGVSRVMGVLDGRHDRRRNSFGVNFGHPIVTNGTLRHGSSQIT